MIRAGIAPATTTPRVHRPGSGLSDIGAMPVGFLAVAFQKTSDGPFRAALVVLGSARFRQIRRYEGVKVEGLAGAVVDSTMAVAWAWPVVAVRSRRGRRVADARLSNGSSSSIGGPGSYSMPDSRQPSDRRPCNSASHRTSPAARHWRRQCPRAPLRPRTSRRVLAVCRETNRRSPRRSAHRRR